MSLRGNLLRRSGALAKVRPDDGGDVTMEELVAQLVRMDPSKLAALQQSELAAATAIAEQEQAAPKALAAAALPANSFVQSMHDFRLEWKKYKQEKSYWCGPATMDAIARGNGKRSNDQAYWASKLGTTTVGTGIENIVSVINSKTTWDSKGGAYKRKSLYNEDTNRNKDIDWFTTTLKTRLAQKAPVVLHPTLRQQYFRYLAGNHGGHFQPGIGYSNNLLNFLEVYNEKDFNASSGKQSAGFKSLDFSVQYYATIYGASYLRTVGA